MKTIFLLCLTGICLCVSAQTSLSVDVKRKLKALHGFENGINMNYLMDGTYFHPRGISKTITGLKNMRVKMLRYPGGEKSDNHLWSVSPFTSASPSMAIKDTNVWPSYDTNFVHVNTDAKNCKSKVLDYDEFMEVCKQVE